MELVVDETLIFDGEFESSSKACNACSKSYSLTFRRHHCRVCRASVCNNCSPGVAKTSVLSSQSYRICLACAESQKQKLLKLQQDEDEANATMDDHPEDYDPSDFKLPPLQKSKNSRITRVARTAKLGGFLFPILTRLRTAMIEAEKLKETEPNEEAFERKKVAFLDAHYTKEAPNYKTMLLAMGGLYNKGAQLAAAQQMLLPPVIVEELKSCFEEMPARSWKSMERAICNCLGDGNKKKGAQVLQSAFSEIKQEPLAAASIGQVHMAKLKNGERVVVKVLYPEIRKNMWADLLTMRTTADMATKLLGLGDMKELIDIGYNEIASNFPRELDFHIEVAHMEHGAKLLKRHGLDIAVPIAHHELSGTQILTQNFLDGETFGKIAEKKDPVQMELARKALMKVLDAMGLMIFKDGFFHADPHPGNVMLLKDGRPGMIDWGQCMNLTKAQRRRLCQVVICMRTRCTELIIQGLSVMGFDFGAIDTTMAGAMMYIMFDTAIESPLKDDITDLASTFRGSPQKNSNAQIRAQGGYLLREGSFMSAP